MASLSASNCRLIQNYKIITKSGKTETSPSQVKGSAPEGGGTGAGIKEQGGQ